MPDSPNFAITYPCEGSPISLTDFATLATDVEAALVTVNAVATAAEHRPFARGHWAILNPAVGVETATSFTTTDVTSTGVTVNTAAGTVTIVTPGIYRIALACGGGPQSSLTMTSQRASFFKNAVYLIGKRYRGTNPTGIGVIGGSFSMAVSLVAGDVIAVSYLWTGTGTINGAGGAGGDFDISLLVSP